jgi:hypothetical protein
MQVPALFLQALMLAHLFYRQITVMMTTVAASPILFKLTAIQPFY